MVDRFVSDPIDVPEREADADLERADLVFYGVDHSGPSFEARIFINAPQADATTGRDDPHYAGSFCIFGHGGCFAATSATATSRPGRATGSTCARRTSSSRRRRPSS